MQLAKLEGDQEVKSSYSKRPKGSLIPTCIALPKPLLDWCEKEARAMGMSRNAFFGFQLQIAKQTPEIRALAKRVEALENKSSSETKISLTSARKREIKNV